MTGFGLNVRGGLGVGHGEDAAGEGRGEGACVVTGWGVCSFAGAGADRGGSLVADGLSESEGAVTAEDGRSAELPAPADDEGGAAAATP